MPKKSTKTDAQIVSEANELARKFYRSMGYAVPKGYRFDKAHHPQELAMWDKVAIAYDHISATDINDALSNLDEDSK